MNSHVFTTDADIGRVLLQRVVSASSGTWPYLHITTLKGVSHHLVSVEKVDLSQMEGDRLTFIMFKGKEPIGRSKTFVWPSGVVKEPAFGIIGIEIHTP